MTFVIGIKEFRRNIASLAKRAAAENVRFIVMRRTDPIGVWHPIEDRQLVTELAAEIATSKKESPQEIKRILRLATAQRQIRQVFHNRARGAAR
jgi:hypothetical protein